MKRKHALQLLKWRRQSPEACRTSPTKRQHMRWIRKQEDMITMEFEGVLAAWGAIVNGEISLVVNPAFRGRGYGKRMIVRLLRWASFRGLESVGVECYKCNPALGFWLKVAENYDCEVKHVENRKYHNGEWYGSIYYEIIL